MSDVTDEQKAARLAAVIEERKHYVVYGLKDRIAACDAEIERLRGKAKAPSQRAEKRA